MLSHSESLTRVLLTQQYTHFVTVTCRRQPLSEQAARRIAKNMYKFVFKTGSYFWVAEKFAEKRGYSDSFHIHAVIDQPEARIDNIWAELYDRYGRTHIERIESADAVKAYVTKYVVKQLCDYDFVFDKKIEQIDLYKQIPTWGGGFDFKKPD